MSVHTALQQAFLQPDLISGLTSPRLGDVHLLADMLLKIIEANSLGVNFSLPLICVNIYSYLNYSIYCLI